MVHISNPNEGFPFGAGTVLLGNVAIELIDPDSKVPAAEGSGTVIIEGMLFHLKTNTFIELSAYDGTTDDFMFRTEQEVLQVDECDLFQGCSERIRVLGDNAAVDGRVSIRGMVSTEKGPVGTNPPAIQRRGRFSLGRKLAADNATTYSTIKQILDGEYFVLDGIHLGKGGSTEASIVLAEDATGTNEVVLWTTISDEVYMPIHKELYWDKTVAAAGDELDFLLLKNRKSGAGSEDAFCYVQGHVAPARHHRRFQVFKDLVNGGGADTYLNMLTIAIGEKVMVEHVAVSTGDADEGWVIAGDSATAPTAATQIPLLGAVGGAAPETGSRAARVNAAFGNATTAEYILVKNVNAAGAGQRAFGYIDGYYLSE